MTLDQQKKTQTSILYVVAGLLLFLGLQWFMGGRGSTEVAYSDFKKALSQGKVQDLTVSPTDIQGSMVGASGQVQAFHTLRVDEPDLVKQLTDKGVKFTGKAQDRSWGACSRGFCPWASCLSYGNSS
jgi:cell division protease FtsH